MPLRVLVLGSCSNESTTDQVQDQVPAHLLLEDRQPPRVPHVREGGAPWRGLCYHLLVEDRQPPLVPHVREEGAPWRGLCYGATAAKSLQSCLTLCDPRDGSPPGSPVPGILQARTLEWVSISFSNA